MKTWHKKDETGQRYGYLTVIREANSRDSSGHVRWECKCDCGNTTIVSGAHLRNRSTRSCGCQQGRRYPNKEQAALNATIGRMKRQAQERGLKWELKKGEVRALTRLPCYYCGKAPSSCAVFGKSKYIYNGLDRLDSSRGYSLENVVPCCHQCNRAKGNMSVREFKEWIEQVYRKLNNENLSCSCV